MPNISGNAGLANAKVCYWSPDHSVTGSVLANGAGAYTITGLTAGDYSVVPFVPGNIFSNAQLITVGAVNITGVNFTRTNAPTIALTPSVTDNFAGTAILGAPNWGPSNFSPADLTNANGEVQATTVTGQCGNLLQPALPGNQYASIAFTRVNIGSQASLEYGIRVTGIDAGYWLFIEDAGNVGTIFIGISKESGGGVESGSFLVNVDLAYTDGDTFAFAAIGSSVYFLKNGVVQFGFTDADHLGGTISLEIDAINANNDVFGQHFAAGAASIPAPAGTIPYLGRVRVVVSAPAGRSNPFLGTVKVLGSAPAGNQDPYLGQVVEVVAPPSASNTNPTIGSVTVVSSAPAGDPDPFLGSVINT